MTCGAQLDFTVGTKYHHLFTVTAEDLLLFAKITKNTHIIHTPARGIVFGALMWGHVSTALTEFLGDNYISVEQSGIFKCPGIIAHEFLVTAYITDIDAHNTVGLTCVVAYNSGTLRVVLEGRVVMRRLF
jgi:hypothetical protein